MNATEYVPGVCNIGSAEIRRRWQAGWLGFAVTILMVYLSVVGQWPAFGRAFIGLPAGLAAAGFLQAALHFCAGFGVLGIKNMGLVAGKTEPVEQADFRRRDQRRAWQILGWSVAAAIVVGGLAVVGL